jgi:dienelactone hydrolase
VVWAHGGPTAQALPLLDTEKAYFTSRGIGVIDVNYGGSTGYGRSYRERLRQQWGVVDVEDVCGAALALAEAGEADRDRLAIRGGSAGGWTALAAVTTQADERRVFSAATSYYGVAGLTEFVSQTHDFESHYLDGLIGPLPGFQAVYTERSPAGHVSEYTCPVLLLQGLEDPVVPPAQSRQMAADLATHGIRHALLEFEGESHGFRRVETIITCLEAELAFYGQILGFRPPGVKPVPLLGGKPEEQARRQAGPRETAVPQQAGRSAEESAGPKPADRPKAAGGPQGGGSPQAPARGTQPQAASPGKPAPGHAPGKGGADSRKGGADSGKGGADSGKGGSAGSAKAATAGNGAESSPKGSSQSAKPGAANAKQGRKGRLGSRKGGAARRGSQQARKGTSG